MVEPSKRRWVRHVARMERTVIHIRFWWESLTERDHYEYQDVDGLMVLK
jgi:hypothetical protein